MPADRPLDWSACEQALQDLVQAGVPSSHPVGFLGLQALLRRAGPQNPAVQARLLPRWWAAFEALQAERSEHRPPAAPAQVGTGVTLQGLRDLVGALGGESAGAAAATSGATPDPSHLGRRRSGATEIRAVREHRRAWSNLSIERQLQRALAQAPEQAGPMNSHALVLQALARMNRWAPEYLQAFVAYVEALVFLDQADLGEAAPATRPAPLPKMQRSSAAKARPRRPPTPARG